MRKSSAFRDIETPSQLRSAARDWLRSKPAGRSSAGVVLFSDYSPGGVCFLKWAEIQAYSTLIADDWHPDC
jgi:hypothetical protein